MKNEENENRGRGSDTKTRFCQIEEHKLLYNFMMLFVPQILGGVLVKLGESPRGKRGGVPQFQLCPGKITQKIVCVFKTKVVLRVA